MSEPAAKTQVASILKQHKAVLVRTKRHNVWKFPDGKTFTAAQSRSDIHAEDNQLRDLKRLLGLNAPDRGRPGVRRDRKYKPGITRAPVIRSSGGVMSEKLLEAGIVADSLKAKLATAQIELADSRAANHRKKLQLRGLQRHCLECWGCRLWRWWRKKFGRRTA